MFFINIILSGLQSIIKIINLISPAAVRKGYPKSVLLNKLFELMIQWFLQHSHLLPPTGALM